MGGLAKSVIAPRRARGKPFDAPSFSRPNFPFRNPTDPSSINHPVFGPPRIPVSKPGDIPFGGPPQRPTGRPRPGTPVKGKPKTPKGGKGRGPFSPPEAPFLRDLAVSVPELANDVKQGTKRRKRGTFSGPHGGSGRKVLFGV